MPVPPTMPPPRNSTLRTERTHEENQERAYIAASHRTDRSLEARMESARRASEIHKQRTGKSYKISEAAVLAGEVYMDDDEELPAPYYQLDQCLRTGTEEFRRRLVDYLTVNVGLRRALSSAIEESNSASANAAAAQSRGSTSASSGFQEGPMLEQGIVQTSPFSPTVFVPPYQGPVSFATPESSNPPTPPTATRAHPQATMAQFQPQIPVAHGTQFYMGPVGLGTLPPHYYQGTQFARIQTAPTIRIPQQAAIPAGAIPAAAAPPTTTATGMAPYYSAVLTPEQYQALSQTIPVRRQSITAGEMIGSPVSDISMTSLRTAPNPTTPTASSGSPEPLLIRRMSVPSKIPESPLRTSTFSPHFQHQFVIDPANSNANIKIPRPTAKLITKDLNNPKVLATSEGSKSISTSPALKLKRRASTDLSAEEPSAKFARPDNSPATTSCSPSQNQTPQSSLPDSDFGLFDFSLPQNTRDILYGPGMYISGTSTLSFAAATQQDLGSKSTTITTTAGTATPNVIPPNHLEETTDTSSTPIFNFSDPELDLSGTLIDPNINSNMPLAFNMDFSKYNNNNNFQPTGNIEDMWQEYFSQKGVQTQQANTGDDDAAEETSIDPRVS
ncbi:hypothetical protein TWF281_011518 [Arthrobotrys megalospora]